MRAVKVVLGRRYSTLLAEDTESVINPDYSVGL